MQIKAASKVWTKKVLLDSGALSFANRFTSPRAVILGYHSIQDRPEDYTDSLGHGLALATSIFVRHVEMIARKYNPVSIAEILLFLRGEKQLPKNSVAVTFDDGYRDNFEIAGPILQRFGIPATFYLTAGWIGTSEIPWFCRLRHAFATTSKSQWSDPVRGQSWDLLDPKCRDAALLAAFDLGAALNNHACRSLVQTVEEQLDVAPLTFSESLMMTWDQARKLHDAGHIIGSHTMTHPNVAHIKNGQAMRWELVESKRQIEENLHAPVAHFCYPHPGLKPQWTQKTREIAREAGYQTAGTTAGGPVTRRYDPLVLNRLIVPRREDHFRWALESAFLGHVA
jgi:peptidoglycan/xylan/chitin deacetylase (PgdA/CDA1 family)